MLITDITQAFCQQYLYGDIAVEVDFPHKPKIRQLLSIRVVFSSNVVYLWHILKYTKQPKISKINTCQQQSCVFKNLETTVTSSSFIFRDATRKVLPTATGSSAGGSSGWSYSRFYITLCLMQCVADAVGEDRQRGLAITLPVIIELPLPCGQKGKCQKTLPCGSKEIHWKISYIFIYRYVIFKWDDVLAK